MARIEDLIAEIKDSEQRRSVAAEVKALKERKQFGLVFEKHLPELVPLFRLPIRVGSTVIKRSIGVTETYRVSSLRDGKAELVADADESRETVPIELLTVVGRMGEPIYPALVPMETAENADVRAPCHVLIEAENYHALQLLEYVYPGKVDCVYIDPPYNTGARDWKYNNDYVDGNDQWRHSKWLTFMAKRLRLARRLLNPNNGVLVVTIDEHEVHHLGCLLEQIFPDAYRQMATIVINQKGVAQGRLSRAEEYAIFCFMKNAFVPPQYDDLLTPLEKLNSKRSRKPRWERLLRGGTNSRREDRENLFFPIYVDPIKRRIVKVCDSLPLDQQPDLKSASERSVAWPFRKDGTFGNWRVSPPTLRELIAKGYVKLGGYDEKRKTWTILYLGKKAQTQIDTGVIRIVGRDPVTKAVDIEYAESQERQIKTVWHRGTHDAGNYGSNLIRSILGEGGRFSFPKSLYAVRDAVAAIVRNRPTALVVDFFAGSGTTLNAITLLNATDGGRRQCVLVTNNELAEEDAKELTARGFVVGDDEWEAHGICRSVTWPRVKFIVRGRRDDGTKLSGDYLTGNTIEGERARVVKKLSFAEGALLSVSQKQDLASLIPSVPQSEIGEAPWFLGDENPVSILFDIRTANAWINALSEAEHVSTLFVVTQDSKAFNALRRAIQETLPPILVDEEEKRPLSQGFTTNVAYLKLDFLDPSDVARGCQFAAILPILWMMAGAKGKLPGPPARNAPWLLPADCPFAVLIQEARFREFSLKVAMRTDLTHIFLVTNSEAAFHDMKAELPPQIRAVQL